MQSNITKVHQIFPLTNHEEFERLYNPTDQKVSYPILINFTANWCGPCKRVDWEFLLQEFGNQFAAIYKCDVDQNKYTPGFCGARSIPSWLIIKAPRKVEGAVQISDTAKIATWIFNTLKSK